MRKRGAKTTTGTAPGMGFEAATYLYLSGGLSRARKRFHAGLAYHRDHVACCCPKLGFDYDFFGPRSTFMDASLRQAIDNRWVEEHVYVKPDQANRQEPPHLAYTLTNDGILAAQTHLEFLDHSDEELDCARMAASLLSFNWLPQSMAVGMTLARDHPSANYLPDLDSGQDWILPPPGTRLGRDGMKRFVEELSWLPYVSVSKSGKPEAGEKGEVFLNFECSIVADRIRDKYSYLEVRDVDILGSTAFLDRDGRKYVPVHMKGPSPRPFRDALSRTSKFLFEKYPAAQDAWFDLAKDIVTDYDNGDLRDRAIKGYEERIQAGETIARLTEDYPVKMRLESKGETLSVAVQEWDGFREAGELATRYGGRGVQSFLEDPGDAFNYLAAFTSLETRALVWPENVR